MLVPVRPGGLAVGRLFFREPVAIKDANDLCSRR